MKYKDLDAEWSQYWFQFIIDNLDKDWSWYDISNKIIVKGDVFLIGNRKAFTYNEPVEFENEINGRYIYTLKPFIDMNLGIEYRYNKRISAFINFNNFTAANYQRWSSYPVQSINIFGGYMLSVIVSANAGTRRP